MSLSTLSRVFRQKDTRPDKARRLDEMSAALHKRISRRQCDLLFVSYDENSQEFVVKNQAHQEERFTSRWQAERFLSKHYRKVKEILMAGCHE